MFNHIPILADVFLGHIMTYPYYIIYIYIYKYHNHPDSVIFDPKKIMGSLWGWWIFIFFTNMTPRVIHILSIVYPYSSILDPLQDDHTHRPTLPSSRSLLGGASGQRRGIQRQPRGLQQGPAVALGAPAAATVPALRWTVWFFVPKWPHLEIWTFYEIIEKIQEILWNDWEDMIWTYHPGKYHPKNDLKYHPGWKIWLRYHPGNVLFYLGHTGTFLGLQCHYKWYKGPDTVLHFLFLRVEMVVK